MREDTPGRERAVAYLVPDQLRVPVDLDVRTRPGATEHQITVELSGEFGDVGIELTARQAANLASRLSLAAHTTDDASDT